MNAQAFEAFAVRIEQFFYGCLFFSFMGLISSIYKMPRHLQMHTAVKYASRELYQSSNKALNPSIRFNFWHCVPRICAILLQYSPANKWDKNTKALVCQNKCLFNRLPFSPSGIECKELLVMLLDKMTRAGLLFS